MKILQMCSSLDGGGIEKILYDYYSNMNHDKYKFDFVKVDTKEGILEKDLREMGCKIFNIPPLRKNYKEYCETLRKILEEGQYDVIHCNGGYRSFIALRIAKQFNIRVRIAHSHAANTPESKSQRFFRLISTYLTIHYATDLFSCGEQAGRWMWGNKAFDNGKVYVVHNAIQSSDFGYDQIKRNLLRKQFNLENSFVIGNVGRLSEQKNQNFLIDMFYDLKKEKENYILLIIGRGELESQLKEKVKKLGIDDSVIFLGVRKDVKDLLNMMDLFVLPSLYEGLPVSMIEVQANGLPAVFSENITNEICINDNVFQLPLIKNNWVSFLLNNKFERDYNGKKNIVGHGYDLKSEASNLQNKYLQG